MRVKNIYNIGAVTFAILATILLGTSSSSVYADSAATDTTTIIVPTSCSMTATVTTEHVATMNGGTYSGNGDYPNGIGSTSIQTFCNDSNGYAIYAIGYTNNEEGNTVLKAGGTLTANDNIVTGTATSGSGNNDVSNWAMKISAVAGAYAPTITNGFGSFSAVPSNYTKVAELTSATDSENGTNIGSTITTTYAAYVSAMQPAGTYTGQVKYVLVHPDYSNRNSYVMQDIADWEDELLPGVQVTALDNRDDHPYTVAKLKDGNIWLLDNLALDPATLKSGVTLSSSNTNLASGATFNLPSSSTSGFNSDSTGYTAAALNTTYKNTDINLAMGQSGTSKAGVYYNYCAASAGTYCMDSSSGSGSAQYDICPKGWRMPSGGPSGEYQALRDEYSSDEEFVVALRTPLSGFFSNGSAQYRGTYGGFWSSTYSNARSMYSLFENTSYVNPQHADDFRQLGFSVRCIHNAIPDMQNITTSELATLMPSIGDTVLLNDNRDGILYRVGKLADGKYWMLDNLALDKAALRTGIILDSSNTNLATGATYNLPNSSTGGFNNTGYTISAVNASYKNTDANLAAGQSGTSRIGVYYNYCAASAGTYCMDSNSGSGNATYDICPKGWRMPSGGSSGEYRALRDEYSSDAEFVMALRTPLSGFFSNGSAQYRGTYGGFWSSTRDNARGMYSLFMNATGGNSQHGDDFRLLGFSVRCVKQ